MRSHKIFWDLTRSFKIFWDLSRSHKIYWFHIYSGIWHLSFDCCLLSFVFWLLTFDFLLLSFDFEFWLLTFFTFESDIWPTDDLMVLALVLKVLTALALMLMALVQSYLIFTDRFWGYRQFQKKDSLTDLLTEQYRSKRC